MHLIHFEVRGYKNFRAPLRLDDLGKINVLHGDNNVGKSNLLEAIGLFFVLLQALREDVRGGPSLAERFERRTTEVPTSGGLRSTVRSLSYFAERGFAADEIFHFDDGSPIHLVARLRLDPVDGGGAAAPWADQAVDVTLGVSRGEEELVITLFGLALEDGASLAPTDEAEWVRLLNPLGPRRRAKATEPRFALVRADRTMLAEPAPAREQTSPLETREPLPREIGMALHRAEEASGVERERFDRFLASLDAFKDMVGEGRWRVRYDRDEDRADLRLEVERGRARPLRLMGSGVQQVAVLLARLAMTGADIVAIEEPELNLRWAAQHRLRSALAALVGKPGGPSQAFVTSHSAAFELEPTFFLLERTADGPRVTRRPSEQAPVLLNPEVQVPPEGARAPLSYVTTDGLVRIPDHVRADLGLEHGGGVVFVREKDHGHYRLLNDAQFLDLFEPRESEP
jgi:hypothetical protein